MRTTRFVNAADAAALIKDGDTVAISGNGAGMISAEAVFAAIEKRFLETGHPCGLTLVHSLGLGDRGARGANRFAHEGMLRKIVAAHFTWAPKMQQLIREEKVEAYCFPGGVIQQLLREIGAGRPGLFTHSGLETFVDPRQDGGRCNRRSREELVELLHIDGREVLRYKPFRVDVALIRGTYADTRGNLSPEEEAIDSDIHTIALAAHNSGGVVIAQVRQVVESGSLHARSVRVPGIMVDAVVEDPGQEQFYGLGYDPAISGEIHAATFPVEPVVLGPEKVIARRALMQIRPGDIVNLGFGISSMVPQIAFEEGVFDRLSFTVEQGAVGGLPLTGFAFGASHNPEAIIDSPAQFDLIDGGGVTVGCLAFAEVDGTGNVNVSRLKAQPHVLAGAGGFINIAMGTRKLVFCGTLMVGGLDIRIEGGMVRVVQEGRFQKFVAQTQDITFNGRRAAEQGQEVWYFTERCVFRLTKGGLVLAEVAPGVDLERDIRAKVGFPLTVAPDCRPMDPRIFEAGPMGLASSW